MVHWLHCIDIKNAENMQKIIFITALLSLAINATLKAQVKKPVAKTVVKTVSNRIDFFSKDADDAVQILSDELKKFKIVLTGLDDNPLYNYDYTTNEKLKDDAESEKTLYFGNTIKARIKASSGNIVNKLTFSTTNLKYYTAIKNILGFNTRTKIGEGYNDTTFRDGNVFANLSSEENASTDNKPANYYYITAERTGHYASRLPDSAQVFNVNSIDIHDDYQRITYAALHFVKNLGYSYYYSTTKLHSVDEKTGKRVGTTYTAHFSKNVSVTFELNKLWLVSEISLGSPDPIAFNKIKKAFNLSDWKYNGAIGEGIGSSYTNKNVDCKIFPTAQTIVFTIRPELSDIDTRVKLAPTPNLDEIIALRYSGSEKAVAKTLRENYLTKIKYDKNAKKYVFDETADDFDFFYLSPGGKLVNGYFRMVLTSQWTAPFLIDSDDKDYLQALSAEFDTSDEYKSNYTKVLTGGQFRIHSNNMEAERERGEALKERAEAERKERDRLAQLEKERIQAEKAAKLNEAILNATESMKKILQKQ